MNKDQAIEFAQICGPYLMEQAKGNLLSIEEKKRALDWYIQGIDLVTIGQHWGLSYEQIKAELNNMEQ